MSKFWRAQYEKATNGPLCGACQFHNIEEAFMIHVFKLFNGLSIVKQRFSIILLLF